MHLDSPLHSGAAGDGPATRSTGADLKIRDVSELLAVPMPTLRSWERRHALPTVARDEHGHRRYTHDDVAVLRRMRDQRVSGVAVGEAVTVATAPPSTALCQQLLAAIHRLDAEETTVVLQASNDAHGLGVTLDEVLLPSMREVGVRWSRGECDIAQEHLATSTVLAWLARRAAELPAPLDEPPIVLACGPLDQHTVSLEAFSVLLREQGFVCRNLGARTPAVSLRQVVAQSSAQAVVLVCQLGRHRPAAVSALHAVSGSGAALFYAGAAFRTAAARRKLPGDYLGGNMSAAALRVTTRLRQTSAASLPALALNTP